jgi:hypothetical protein
MMMMLPKDGGLIGNNDGVWKRGHKQNKQRPCQLYIWIQIEFDVCENKTKILCPQCISTFKTQNHSSIRYAIKEEAREIQEHDNLNFIIIALCR